MAVGRVRVCRPKAKSFWTLVRRLLLRRGHHRPPAAGGAEEDRKEEKSGLLSRSSLEQLLGTENAGAPADSDACRCAKKHGQPVAVLARPEAAPVSAATATGGRGGAAVHHRRFAFGGFRRRLLMRRPWRPVLVAIPE
ncbi:unnamed protein product [Urochloa decumbens]|uniref:Uncharacterized protein n=1 Tax=Urochloa decumbens TaxID=240449 RepID=A0ABC8ZNL2_9POAL